jgi:hypothetical protein
MTDDKNKEIFRYYKTKHARFFLYYNNIGFFWPWDGHYKSILLPADEEIMGSL